MLEMFDRGECARCQIYDTSTRTAGALNSETFRAVQGLCCCSSGREAHGSDRTCNRGLPPCAGAVGETDATTAAVIRQARSAHLVYIASFRALRAPRI